MCGVCVKWLPATMVYCAGVARLVFKSSRGSHYHQIYPKKTIPAPPSPLATEWRFARDASNKTLESYFPSICVVYFFFGKHKRQIEWSSSTLRLHLMHFLFFFYG